MPEGYQGASGKNFNQLNALTFNVVEAVVVSGDGPNFCGHMILRVDDFYFHISGVYNYPMVIPKDKFNKYIKENEKTELFRTKRILKNKTAAKDKLKSLLSDKWLWLIIPNNCTDLLKKLLEQEKMILV